MSVPTLRRPKSNEPEVNPKINISSRKPDVEQLIILTLRNDKKLVVSSDSLHGIIITEMYKCLFCNIEIDSNECKEAHKTLNNHITFLQSHPFIEELDENLIRQVNNLLLSFILSSALLRSATQHAMPPEYGGKWGTVF